MVVANHSRLDYTVTVLGNASLSDIQGRMSPANVPPPLSWFYALGCRVSADGSSISSNVVTRETTVILVPDATATATATRDTSVSAGPITKLTLTAAGSGYSAPPIVVFSEAEAGITPLVAAQAHATLGVASVVMVANGSGYNTAKVTFVGGGLPGDGVPATGHATIVGHAITGIVVDSPGGPYHSPPTIVITGDGTGAIATVVLAVTSLVLDNPGEAYVSPIVTLVPLFKHLWPDGVDQRVPFYNLLTVSLARAAQAPCLAAAPVMLP